MKNVTQELFMKKNMLIVLSVILVIIVAGLIGSAFFFNKIQNPKGCISLETAHYSPAYEIFDGASYAPDSEEITKIYGIQNSCMAVLEGKDSSVDKCKALENLSQTIYAIAFNAANSGNKTEVQRVVKETETLQNSLKASAPSCGTVNNDFNEDINELIKELNEFLQYKK